MNNPVLRKGAPMLPLLLLTAMILSMDSARAEQVKPSSYATSSDYMEETDGEDDSSTESCVGEECENSCGDEVVDANDDHDSGNRSVFIEGKNANQGKSATPSDYVDSDRVVISPAYGSLYIEGMTLEAAWDLTGLTSEDLAARNALTETEELSENLQTSFLETSAALTGPNTLVIEVEAEAPPLNFYGFRLGRCCDLVNQKWVIRDPDVEIVLPDGKNRKKAPEIGEVTLGTVEILSTNIVRSRYTASRRIRIRWTLEGYQTIAAFAEAISEDSLFLDLGGVYGINASGDTDECKNNGHIEVDGLCGYAATGACPHEPKTYVSLGDKTHHTECSLCGYDFGIEDHVMEDGHCTLCPYGRKVSGDLVYRFRGYELREPYEALPGEVIELKSFAGYDVPGSAAAPESGGDLVISCTPIGYEIHTGQHRYSLSYDESLFLPGEKRKGYTLMYYIVRDIS